MTDSTITFLVLGAAVVLFVTNRIPVALVAIGVSLSLWATGVLELDQSLAGFGDPTVLFIASLFVVSEALNATGVTTWIGQLLLERSGGGGPRVVVLVMTVCALVTALISVNGAVAALIPVVVVIAIRVRQPSSQLLMPLAFGAHAGALLALTGSPVNVLVSNAAGDAGVGSSRSSSSPWPVSPSSSAPSSSPWCSAPRVLPHRNAKVMPADFSNLAATLIRDYQLEEEDLGDLFNRSQGVAELVVPPRSGLIGQVAFPGMVTESGHLVMVAIQRDGEQLGPGECTLAAGDAILVRGTWEALSTQIEGDDDVLTVDEPDLVRRQVVPLGLGAKGRSACSAAWCCCWPPAPFPPPWPACWRPVCSCCCG